VFQGDFELVKVAWEKYNSENVELGKNGARLIRKAFLIMRIRINNKLTKHGCEKG
jgi:hypothetical protein